MGRPKMNPGTTKAERAAAAKNATRLSSEELTIYASGNGSLSFVWQQYDHSRECHIASGRPVTMDEARKYMGTNPRGISLVERGWKLWNNYGIPTLIADVERIGPNRLRMRDREYTYHINQADPFYIRDKEVRAVSLTLTYDVPSEEYEPLAERTVKNGGTLAEAAYFLNHEEAINATPPESLTYQLA